MYETNTFRSRCDRPKFYGIPGLRLGFAVAPTSIAEAIRREIPPWSVNNLAQAGGIAMLKDHDYAKATRLMVREQRDILSREMSKLDGLKVYPGTGNFIFIQLTRPDLRGPQLAEGLLKHKIAIRICDNYVGLDDRFVRIAVKSPEANDTIVAALQTILAEES